MKEKTLVCIILSCLLAVIAADYFKKPKEQAITGNLLTNSPYLIEPIGNEWIIESNRIVEVEEPVIYHETTGTNAPASEWVEVRDDFSNWDPYTPEQRAKFKADRKRRGRNTFGFEIANDGTNLVLVTHDYSARDGSNKRLIYPLTNRFVQVAFYHNGEIDISMSNSSIREIEGNLNLSQEEGFWIEPNQPYRGEGWLNYSNITILHTTGIGVKLETR